MAENNKVCAICGTEGNLRLQHLSHDESDAELIEIDASEILDKIQKGKPVEYDHAWINGDLDLNKLDLPFEHNARTEFQIRSLKLPEEYRFVSSIIIITNSVFDGTINISNVLFKCQIDLRYNIFNDFFYINGAIFNNGVTFEESIFEFFTDIGRATFSGDAIFAGVEFEAVPKFKEATFYGTADFLAAKFNFEASFDNAAFKGPASFYGAIFNEEVSFKGAMFYEEADFTCTNFNGTSGFEEAIFNKELKFFNTKFEENVLSFKNATFIFPKSQENACRRAKNILAKAGIRDEEEYHFYREMEAKRIQKGLRGNSGRGLGYIFFETEIWSFRKLFWYDFFEWLFVQKIFGYGIHPWWLIFWWLIIVAMFASLYAYGHIINGATNLFDYFKVSLAISIAPGYIATIINPVGTGYSFNAPFYQAVAIAETVVGTFLWASFIATFAKKYMR
jgi:hypothetical protein